MHTVRTSGYKDCGGNTSNFALEIEVKLEKVSRPLLPDIVGDICEQQVPEGLRFSDQRCRRLGADDLVGSRDFAACALVVNDAGLWVGIAQPWWAEFGRARGVSAAETGESPGPSIHPCSGEYSMCSSAPPIRRQEKRLPSPFTR